MGTSSGFLTNLLGGGPAVDSRVPWVDVRDVARAIEDLKDGSLARGVFDVG